jgi:hypothetical protein
VLRVCPSAFNGVLGDATSDFGLPGTGGSLQDPWFCPCHMCVGCHALQDTECTLSAAEVPLSLYANQQRVVEGVESCMTQAPGEANGCSGGRIRQKALAQCSTCPLAACNDCDKHLSSPGATSLMQTKRFGEVSTLVIDISPVTSGGI